MSAAWLSIRSFLKAARYSFSCKTTNTPLSYVFERLFIQTSRKNLVLRTSHLPFHVSPLIDKRRIYLTRKTLRFQCKQRRNLIRGKLAKEYSLPRNLSKLFCGLINFADCLSRIVKQKQTVYAEKRNAIKPRSDSSSYWNPSDLNVSTYRSLNQLSLDFVFSHIFYVYIEIH